MKFLYEYRTHENERKFGEISASSSEGAYSALRAQGIRPSKVVLAPGAFNWICSFGKRVLAIFTLSVLLAFSVFLYYRANRTIVQLVGERGGAIDRCQVYGDPAFIQQCEEMGWTNVFSYAGDRLLAAYAQPGRKVVDTLSLDCVNPFRRKNHENALTEILAAVPIKVEEREQEETRRIKRIVIGMREELRQYVIDGGTVGGYCKELVARQKREQMLRNRMIEELSRMDMHAEKFGKSFSVFNDDLRMVGIRPIILSEITEKKSVLSEKVSAQPPKVSR